MKDIIRESKQLTHDELSKIAEQSYTHDFKNAVMLLGHIGWQNERIEQLEKALNEITELGWSERFGGGYQYMGEYHAEAIKIARQALGKEE